MESSHYVGNSFIRCELFEDTSLLYLQIHVKTCIPRNGWEPQWNKRVIRLFGFDFGSSPIFQPTNRPSNPSCIRREGLTWCTIPQFNEQPHDLAANCASPGSPSALAHNIPCSCKIVRLCEFTCDFISIGVAKGCLWFKDHLCYLLNQLGFLPFLREFCSSPWVGHAGITRTYKRLEIVFYCYVMRKDVEQLMAGCATCERNKYQVLQLVTFNFLVMHPHK